MNWTVKPLRQKDYETLTQHEGGGGCYCAFWHQKFASHAAWLAQCKAQPERNRETVLDRARQGFHVGVVVYQDDQARAWLGVGPLPETYWAWKRVASLGLAAAHTAGIVCFTLAEAARGKHLSLEVLEAVKAYGKAQGWKTLEAYPFDPAALAQHGDSLLWPGRTESFVMGFARVGSHWMEHRTIPARSTPWSCSSMRFQQREIDAPESLARWSLMGFDREGKSCCVASSQGVRLYATRASSSWTNIPSSQSLTAWKQGFLPKRRFLSMAVAQRRHEDLHIVQLWVLERESSLLRGMFPAEVLHADKPGIWGLSAVAFSRDGERAAGFEHARGVLTVWELASGKALCTLPLTAPRDARGRVLGQAGSRALPEPRHTGGALIRGEEPPSIRRCFAARPSRGGAAQSCSMA